MTRNEEDEILQDLLIPPLAPYLLNQMMYGTAEIKWPTPTASCDVPTAIEGCR